MQLSIRYGLRILGLVGPRRNRTAALSTSEVASSSRAVMRGSSPCPATKSRSCDEDAFDSLKVNRNLFRAFVRPKEISPWWKHCQLRSCTIQQPAVRLRETLHIARVHRCAGRDRCVLRLLIMTVRAPDQPEDNLPGGIGNPWRITFGKS